jgi:hypothetical protein
MRICVRTRDVNCSPKLVRSVNEQVPAGKKAGKMQSGNFPQDLQVA